VTLEALFAQLVLWVSRYIAVCCLISIAMWGVGMYLWHREWRSGVRDALVYFLSIGGLTLILALRPEKTDTLLWSAVTWFSLTLLIVLELLWLSFLVELLLYALNTVRPRPRPPAQTTSPRT